MSSPPPPLPHVTRLSDGPPCDAMAPAVADSAIGHAATIDCAAVKAPAHEPRFLTFIGPDFGTGIYPFARIAGELGRTRPDIPILVVGPRQAAGAVLACGLDLTAHPNLHLMEYDGDPRRHWGVTRVALLPWLAPETPPSPALHALVNGIPVVASDRGSVVDALGRAGVVLPLPRRLSQTSRTLPTGAEMAPWTQAITQLWDDPVYYDEHRRLALGEAERRASPVDGKAALACPPAPPTWRDKAVVLVPYVDKIEGECERALNQLEVVGIRVVRKPGCSAIDLAPASLPPTRCTTAPSPCYSSIPTSPSTQPTHCGSWPGPSR